MHVAAPRDLVGLGVEGRTETVQRLPAFQPLSSPAERSAQTWATRRM